MAEDKVIPEPTIEPQQKAPEKAAGEIDYNELIAGLEKAGISSAKQLDGKLQAASERGHLANLLGEKNQQLSQMNQTLAAMQAEMKAMQNRHSKSGGYDEDGQAGAIDIGDLIEKKVSGVIEREKRQAMEQQQRAWAAWNEIQQDEDYHLVSDKWTKKMSDPNFAIALQAGTVDPVKEYRIMLRDHYKGAVRLAAETIKSLTQGVKPPEVHVEGSGRVSASKTVEPNETQKTINPIREKVNAGKILSEDEELAALQAVLMGGGARR
jgi:hypothetical protein